MTGPTNCRSSSPSPSSSRPGPGKEGQSNTSKPPPAPSSPQTSQSDDHTTSIVEGDWVAINSSSVPGSKSSRDLSASFSEAHDTTSRAGSVDQNMSDSEEKGDLEDFGSREEGMGADAEENVIGKLAARLAEREGGVQGDREVQELVERGLRAYGIDLGSEREGDGEEDADIMVKTRGKEW
ncbi:hypothetical protein KC357_g4199 [Hortaea werneckii]|nr:hypothetical protein KC357_g4199 [Hortaea werneckii]